MDLNVLVQLAPRLLDGFWMTVLLNAVSIPIAAALGLLIAVLRLSRVRPLSFLGGIYSDFFRSTPFFVQIIWVFYALPIVTELQLSRFSAGVIGLSAYMASYYAEVYRAGILAVPMGQREAAISQGMRDAQAMRRVILPQAITKMLPAFIGTVVIQIKESSIVSVIALADLMFSSSTVAGVSGRPLEVLTAAAVLYIVLAYPPTILANHLHRRQMRSA